MLIFTLLFGRLAGLDERTGGIPYPIFAFAGLLPWTFFSGAVITSSNSLVSNAHLLTKVYFPRIIVPVSAVGGLLLDFILGAVFLVGLMFYYDVAPTLKFLMFPALAALTILLAVGVGTLLSALNVKYRDIRHALPFLMQMWMFASPVIYPTSLVPENWRWVLSLNPMTGIVEGFRAALFAGQNFNWRMLSASAAITLVIASVAILIFRRAEKEFADIV
jgi:lipopolysaccharide transport system permease protein